MDSGSGLRRRAFLAGAAGALATTSGCVGELRNIAGRERTRQLSLNIVAAPAANDAYALRVANTLAENLSTAGIDAQVDIMEVDVLLREILINHDFDIYVGRYPEARDPDVLRTLLHSEFREEAGWQNPFGFSDLTLDDLLDEQRYVDEDRRVEAVHEVQRTILEEEPFTVVAAPDRIAAVTKDRFEGWPAGGIDEPAEYLTLRRVGDAETLEMILRDGRITRNFNPISGEYRHRSDAVGLLYEPLVRLSRPGAEAVPWLAREVEWDEGETLEATITLRDTYWHDEEPVTPSDVVFTYEFLADTSLGEFDTPEPTSWRRGRLSLVDSVTEMDGGVRFTFDTSRQDIARRGLTLPILPETVWAERNQSADIGPLDIAGQTTRALVTANDDPIGSGPYRFASATGDEELELERFEDHFLFAGDDEGLPEEYTRSAQYEDLLFTAAPSHDAAVELLVNDDGDATADGLQATAVARVLREDEVDLEVEGAKTFYHVGFNTRSAPMSDAPFRRTVARLLDREYLVSEAFDGYAEPAQCPLDGQWVPEELAWDGEAELAFLGEDGDLDEEAAREAFQEAGYQYDGDVLVRRG